MTKKATIILIIGNTFYINNQEAEVYLKFPIFK